MVSRPMETSVIPQLFEANVSDVEKHYPFHAKTILNCIEELDSRFEGLTTEEIASRQKTLPSDTFEASSLSKTKQIVLASFKNLLTVLLTLVAVLSFVMGEMIQGLVILAAMLAISGVQGLIQWKIAQQKAKSVEEHTEQTKYLTCEVKRNGSLQVVSAEELVPGDILVLSSGQIVRADARLIKSDHLQVDESLLTGESILVPKDSTALFLPDEDPTAQTNMIFAGTKIKTGSGEALVVSVGRHTLMGKISELAKNTDKEESSFAKELTVLGRRMLLVVFVLAAFAIAVEAQRGTQWPQLLQLALVMSVAALPGILPSVASLISSMALKRLSDSKIMVKNFHAVEVIGDVSVVCSDKTGTLTENHLVLDQVYLPELGAVPYNESWRQAQAFDNVSLEMFLRVARLSNATTMDGLRSTLMGDPIDVALFRATPAFLDQGFRKRKEIPFDPNTMRSAMLVEETSEGQMFSMIKGAPEEVIKICKFYMRPDGEIVPLDFMQKAEFIVDNRDIAAANSSRLIGCAVKQMEEGDTDPYANAVFVGWMCLYDPPKPGVVEAVSAFHKANVSITMITGDQPATAESTARELGILLKDSLVWQRAQLEECDGKIPSEVRVFARTKPEEKLYIVDALQQSGEVVAMVGDGVNDAPALQKSDVAIVMGIKGAESAKDSADILLMTDRLEGIIHLMKESRQFKKKMTGCIQYLLSGNLGLIFFITASTMLGKGLALSVVEILWLNLLMVTLPTLALALEPEHATALLPVTERGEKTFLNRSRIFLLVYWGAFMMLAGLAAYAGTIWLLKQPQAVASTMAFSTMAFAMVLNVFNIQFVQAQGRLNEFLKEISDIPITGIVLGLTVGLQFLAIYNGSLAEVLGTVNINILQLAMCFIIAAAFTLLSGMTLDTSRLKK